MSSGTSESTTPTGDADIICSDPPLRGFACSVGNDDRHLSPPPFVLSQIRIDSHPSSTPDYGLLQNTAQAQLPPVANEQATLSIENGVRHHELDVSLGHESALYPFFDASSMNEVWQTPAPVGTPTTLISRFIDLYLFLEYHVLV